MKLLLLQNKSEQITKVLKHFSKGNHQDLKNKVQMCIYFLPFGYIDNEILLFFRKKKWFYIHLKSIQSS